MLHYIHQLLQLVDLLFGMEKETLSGFIVEKSC